MIETKMMQWGSKQRSVWWVMILLKTAVLLVLWQIEGYSGPSYLRSLSEGAATKQ